MCRDAHTALSRHGETRTGRPQARGDDKEGQGQGLPYQLEVHRVCVTFRIGCTTAAENSQGYATIFWWAWTKHLINRKFWHLLREVLSNDHWQKFHKAIIFTFYYDVTMKWPNQIFFLKFSCQSQMTWERRCLAKCQFFSLTEIVLQKDKFIST